MSNSLGPGQAQQNVWPDLGPNCLQRLSANCTSSQRVNVTSMNYFLVINPSIFASYYQEVTNF